MFANPRFEALFERMRQSPTQGHLLDLLNFMVDRLADHSGCHVEFGSYFAMDDAFHVDVRGRQPFAGLSSDSWEGMIFGELEKTGEPWVEALVFPFLGGARVARNGRVIGECTPSDADAHWLLQLEDDQWGHGAWTSSGYYEWQIEQPGDLYRGSLECVPSTDSFLADAPLLVDLRVMRRHLIQRRAPQENLAKSPFGVSLIHVNRGHEGRNLASGGAQPLRLGDPRVLTKQWTFDKEALRTQVDLRAWNIQGGWSPGKYRLSLRVQLDEAIPHNFESEISAPVTFRIEP